MTSQTKRNLTAFFTVPDKDIKELTLSDFENKDISDIVFGNILKTIRTICKKIGVIICVIALAIVLMGSAVYKNDVNTYPVYPQRNIEAACVIKYTALNSKIRDAVNRRTDMESDYMGFFSKISKPQHIRR